MGSVYAIEGLLIYIYAFDHNPPHIHVRGGDSEFTIELKSRKIEGKATSKAVYKVNSFIDEHELELQAIWDKAQKGEKIEKIN